MSNPLTAVEMGILVATVLYGVNTAQGFSYTDHGKNDPTWLKLFVLSIWTLETVHVALSWVYLHTLTVSDRGSASGLIKIDWSFAACIVIHDCLNSAVQAFFAYRIYKISRRLVFVITQWIGCVMRVVLILVLLAYATQASSFAEVIETHRNVTIAVVSVSTWVDLLNTVMLCIALTKHRNPGMKQTTRIIDKIIIWSVETGFLTCICALAILIVMLVSPLDGVWEALMMIYARLYSNSLLVSLNSRGYLRRHADATYMLEKETRVTNLVCNVQVETHNDSDVIQLTSLYDKNSAGHQNKLTE